MFLEVFSGAIAGALCVSYVSNNYPIIYNETVKKVTVLHDKIVNFFNPVNHKDFLALNKRLSILENNLDEFAELWETTERRNNDGYAYSEPTKFDILMKRICKDIPLDRKIKRNQQNRHDIIQQNNGTQEFEEKVETINVENAIMRDDFGRAREPPRVLHAIRT